MDTSDNLNETQDDFDALLAANVKNKLVDMFDDLARVSPHERLNVILQFT